ncbi:hypothetical protein VSWAT3_15007 [Vibrionales bacterium SWAT-3]|nr:hypothetical protein VSWAT3_15007 [Vibrionales bacterium SWAT-3]
MLLRDTRYEIRDTRYEIRDTRYEIRDTRYEIRDTRYETIGVFTIELFEYGFVGGGKKKNIVV